MLVCFFFGGGGEAPIRHNSQLESCEFHPNASTIKLVLKVYLESWVPGETTKILKFYGLSVFSTL